MYQGFLRRYPLIHRTTNCKGVGHFLDGRRDEAERAGTDLVGLDHRRREEAGALDTMLLKVAEFYEEEVSNTVDALSSLIEPMVMVIIGGLVGSIVIAMYLPIFKIAMTVM